MSHGVKDLLVKRYPSQTPLRFKPEPLGFGLAILFFLVPYLVDVAYYGDSTPTHYAQANFSDGEEAFVLDGKAALGLSLDQEHSAGAGVRLAVHLPGLSISCPFLAVFSPRYLSFSTHLSRPPPVI